MQLYAQGFDTMFRISAVFVPLLFCVKH